MGRSIGGTIPPLVTPCREVLLDERGKTVRVWRFIQGLPVRWAGPALDAGQSRVAIEEIEIAHQGLRQTGAGSGSLADTVSNLFS